MAGDPLKRAGMLIFAGAAQFLVFIAVAESMYSGYEVSSQPLSDLGATCNSGSCVIPASSTVFDSTVFLLGALTFIGAFFIYISRSRLVGGIGALSAWGIMGVGIFPETTGELHTVVSLIAFLFGGIVAIVSYRMVRPPFSYFAVVLGIVGLTALVLYASGTYLGIGQGGMELLIVYPEVTWALGFGAYLMGRPTERQPVQIPL